MEEIEDPTESLHEHIHEGAHHAQSEGKDKWVIFVALTTAIIAVLSAITGLLAAYHSDEAMIKQLHASDQWAYYQAKGIKTDVLISEGKVLKAMGKQPDTADVNKIKENKEEQKHIKAEAEAAQEESHKHLEGHDILARSVTLFQISIAISAIAILVKKRLFWFVSLGFAAFAAYFFIMEVLG
ncbi:hypothetical protein BEL04_00550 [Mucilaginibacter sp. PPCGB 2223]|uniref:DUF4337 family protein n=1 Tax=Mucilaginibacter sp. PPCGB 2223 TaxID=1886027 RepID=UPI0008240740|nr:DUF4337 family protein [Mucilaginibacter sp. PPCGB 2223]OCX52854.1 hypothetical protein BEL04_00550 [Mucilaginibacter sp. PPCGB 2223]